MYAFSPNMNICRENISTYFYVVTVFAFCIEMCFVDWFGV